jgi:hypothetical protein
MLRSLFDKRCYFSHFQRYRDSARILTRATIDGSEKRRSRKVTKLIFSGPLGYRKLIARNENEALAIAKSEELAAGAPIRSLRRLAPQADLE